MRELEILLFLMKNEIVTVKELARQFDVSDRTIQRDLDSLSILGVPIVSKRGKYGGVSIDKSYVISKSLLTKMDYNSIITSLYIGNNIGENINATSVLNKFFLLDSNKVQKVHAEVSEYFVVDLMNKKINMFEGINKLINKALENKSVSKIYIGEHSYKIKPISYILKSDGIYLYFHCKNKYSLINIQRIDKLDILEENYKRDFTHYKNNKDINIIK